MLTERRVSPYGLHGGEDGRKGQNLVFFRDGRTVNIEAKISIALTAGDVFHLETPGGGGYGKASTSQASKRRRVGEDTTFDVLDSFSRFPERGSVHQYKLSQVSG